MTPRHYPPVGFHFRVEVLGLPKDDNDLRFTEVGGLSVELATEEVPEGGENRFTQKYPLRTKYPDLVLKRGLVVGSKVASWIADTVLDGKIDPKDIDVTLLNEEHQPLLTWHVIGAYPTRWAASDLNASASAIVVETLQLTYRYFTMQRS